MPTTDDKLKLAKALFGAGGKQTNNSTYSTSAQDLSYRTATAKTDSTNGKCTVLFDGDEATDGIEIPSTVAVKQGQIVNCLVVNGTPTIIGVIGWGDSVDTDISDQDERITKNEEDITDHEERISDNEEQIGSLNESIGEIKGTSSNYFFYLALDWLVAHGYPSEWNACYISEVERDEWIEKNLAGTLEESYLKAINGGIELHGKGSILAKFEENEMALSGGGFRINTDYTSVYSSYYKGNGIVSRDKNLINEVVKTMGINRGIYNITNGGNYSTNTSGGRYSTNTSGGNYEIDTNGGNCRTNTNGGNCRTDTYGGDLTILTSIDIGYPTGNANIDRRGVRTFYIQNTDTSAYASHPGGWSIIHNGQWSENDLYNDSQMCPVQATTDGGFRLTAKGIYKCSFVVALHKKLSSTLSGYPIICWCTSASGTGEYAARRSYMSSNYNQLISANTEYVLKSDGTATLYPFMSWAEPFSSEGGEVRTHSNFTTVQIEFLGSWN